MWRDVRHMDVKPLRPVPLLFLTGSGSYANVQTNNPLDIQLELSDFVLEDFLPHPSISSHSLRFQNFQSSKTSLTNLKWLSSASPPRGRTRPKTMIHSKLER